MPRSNPDCVLRRTLAHAYRRIAAPLDALNARVMHLPAGARFTLVCRILLAVAFIPTGSVKLMGDRFTSLGVNTSVGGFSKRCARPARIGDFSDSRKCWPACCCSCRFC
jgi:hypothetical protein